jgi:hypothetical protein
VEPKNGVLAVNLALKVGICEGHSNAACSRRKQRQKDNRARHRQTCSSGQRGAAEKEMLLDTSVRA